MASDQPTGRGDAMHAPTRHSKLLTEHRHARSTPVGRSSPRHLSVIASVPRRVRLLLPQPERCPGSVTPLPAREREGGDGQVDGTAGPSRASVRRGRRQEPERGCRPGRGQEARAPAEDPSTDLRPPPRDDAESVVHAPGGCDQERAESSDTPAGPAMAGRGGTAQDRSTEGCRSVEIHGEARRGCGPSRGRRRPARNAPPAASSTRSTLSSADFSTTSRSATGRP